MTDVARRLLQGFKNVEWRRFLYMSESSQKFDLVTASYVLSEIQNPEEVKKVIYNLWEVTNEGGVLVQNYRIS